MEAQEIMMNCFSLDPTVVSSLPMPVFHMHPPLSIIYMEINAKGGVVLETAVQVDEALIVMVTFMYR